MGIFLSICVNTTVSCMPQRQMQLVWMSFEMQRETFWLCVLLSNIISIGSVFFCINQLTKFLSSSPLILNHNGERKLKKLFFSKRFCRLFVDLSRASVHVAGARFEVYSVTRSGKKWLLWQFVRVCQVFGKILNLLEQFFIPLGKFSLV